MRTPESGDSLRYALNGLYASRGYALYKMNKFEEYDLYAHNKDFLVSDSVITFTDGSGKLLALKPDVTLSIVKNTRDAKEGLRKLYYNENVYRVAKGTRNFREIMQVGLECIGRVDDYCIYEVLSLAAGSVSLISEHSMLSVSHLGILSEAMDAVGIPADRKPEVLACLGERNPHELSALLLSLGISEEEAKPLYRLSAVRGTVREVLPELRALLPDLAQTETADRFLRVLAALEENDAIRVDFSVIGDLHYYNGFVFKGYVDGIPNSVLSGGQYDLLMRKMERNSHAIGFAVYLDQLERFYGATSVYDADTVLLYDEATPLEEVSCAVYERTEKGERVLACTTIPEGLRFRELIRVADIMKVSQ